MAKDLYLFYSGEHEYDTNNCYGFFMFNPDRCEGHYTLVFTRSAENNYEPVEMNPKGGVVLFNGEHIEYDFFKSVGSWNNYWFISIEMRDKNMQPGETYTIHVEGFETADGLVMDPNDTILHCTPKFSPDGDGKYREHDDATLTVAEEGAVLLENKTGLLPLKDKKINVFGDIYTRFFNMTGGAGCIFPRFSVGFTDGMTEFGGFEFNPELVSFYKGMKSFVPEKDMLDRAKTFSDTAIITISRGSSENMDNVAAPGGYYLTENEKGMIAAVTSVFENTVLIINTGYPIDVRFVDKYNIKSVLWFSYAGQYAGRALADILTGKTNPSGRLPDTWAYDYTDYPSSKNFIQRTEVLGRPTSDTAHVTDVYEEGLYIGYRYFDTFSVPVKYPFGYGLSYSSFRYRVLSSEYDGAKLTVKAEVRNTGIRPGKYVLELFVSEPDGELEKCSHKLIDFRKTREIEPSGTDILTFEVTNDDFASYSPKKAQMIMESGEYQIFIGEHVNSLEYIYSFRLDETMTVKQLHNYCVAREKIRELSKRDPDGTYPTGKKSFADLYMKSFDFSKTKRKKFESKGVGTYEGDIIYYEEAEKNPELLDNFIAQMSVEELARILVCSQAWAVDTNGVAGSVYKLDKYGMKPFLTADGNSALRIKDRTMGFPSSVMVCATFNRDMAYTVGRVVAEEAADWKIHMILAPAMNLHRNPLCGRNAEYFSEDPILAGIMAGYHSKGLQDNNVGAVIKHVIANNSELCRMRSHSIIGERALRELYVKVFEVSMRIAKADGLMTSYNATNDCYTGMDEELMLGIFREELGFDGYIMTDWNSYSTCDPTKAIAAGNNWLTPGSPDDKYTKPIVDAVNSGKITLSRLQDNAKYLVRVMLKYTKFYSYD